MSRSKKSSKRTANNKTHSNTHRLKKAHKIVLGFSVVLLVGVLVWLPTVNMADAPEITVYKSATCGCCKKWVTHMRDAGFKVITHNRQDMNEIKQTYGVEYKNRSCHTARSEPWNHA